MTAKLASIVAPSGNVLSVEDIMRAAGLLEEHGWSVRIGNSVFESNQRFGARSDELRLEDFNDSLRHSSLVLAARGGYGLSRIVDGIDFEVAKQRNVWVAGFSDITLFSLAYLAKYGGKSLHAPTASYLGKKDIAPGTIGSFFHALSSPTQTVTFSTECENISESGILWGGNLSIVSSTIGTPYFPQIKGGILFVEDVAEPAYKTERDLLHLYHSGVLQNQKALVLGHFSKVRNSAHDFGYSLTDAIDFIRSKVKIPIVQGLPFGHSNDLCTLIIGAETQLSVDSNRCRLIMKGGPAF